MTAISKPDAPTEIEDLQARLAEAEGRLAEAQELINAIQSGDVDAVVVSGPQGDQVFTLQGAEYAYRALVEAMNEGAATLGANSARKRSTNSPLPSPGRAIPTQRNLPRTHPTTW